MREWWEVLCKSLQISKSAYTRLRELHFSWTRDVILQIAVTPGHSDTGILHHEAIRYWHLNGRGCTCQEFYITDTMPLLRGGLRETCSKLCYSYHRILLTTTMPLTGQFMVGGVWVYTSHTCYSRGQCQVTRGDPPRSGGWTGLSGNSGMFPLTCLRLLLVSHLTVIKEAL